MVLLEDLAGLELLHRDLLAQAELRLPNIDRLWLQLEARIEEFRRLLDKAPRNEQSRKTLESGMDTQTRSRLFSYRRLTRNTGKIKIDDEEYSVNDDFKQGALMLADQLNIDELDAAKLFFLSQDDSELLGRSILEASIIKFHQLRKYLLDCFRLVLQLASAPIDFDPDAEPEAYETQETVRSNFKIVVAEALEAANNAANGHKFVQKVLQSMADIKIWLRGLEDTQNRATVLGQVGGEYQETHDFQRVSLIQQHECLGAILQFLVKAKYSSVENFKNLLRVLRGSEKYDILLVHYLPATGAFIGAFGGPDVNQSVRQARELDKHIVDSRGENLWALPHLHSAITVWWLAEYSAWYREENEPAATSDLAGINLEEEGKERDELFERCLKDGAFEFLMSVSADVKSSVWQDPARHSLRDMLQSKVQGLTRESVLIEFGDYFQLGLMEELEQFIDAFITNLPDVLRKLRTDELEQRQLSPSYEHDLDLERFLVMMSYTYEGRPEAAQAFWADPDSNLSGFLIWASKRASTPLNSAFCELLQAISQDETCATAAHKFLLEDMAPIHSKFKSHRSYALNWGGIFRDLQYYTTKFRSQPVPHQSSGYRLGKPSDAEMETEPDEKVMLESFLRLISKVFMNSYEARFFVLGQGAPFHLIPILYELASSNIEPRLRGLAFTTLRALATDRDKVVGEHLWTTLDNWICGGYSPAAEKTNGMGTKQSGPAVTQGIFQEVAVGFEQPNAFVQLLTVLMQPTEDYADLNDGLPFPETLGGASRMPGVEPFIDFAIGTVFSRKAQNGELGNGTNQRLLSLTCLDFIATCLGTFNEELVIIANQDSGIDVDSAMRTSSLFNYACLHPFARAMEWMYNERVMNALFATIHERVEVVGNAAPDSPLVLSLLAAIHVMTLIMDLQPTYLDLVRPLLKKQPAHAQNPVANAAYAFFEDGVLNHLSVIVDLGLYCGAGHPALALASLKLLQKFSTSPKLISPISNSLPGGRDRNKVIAALEREGDAERISRSLITEFESDIDPEAGADCPNYIVKIHILEFLISCLRTGHPGKPSMAHLLLGFKCHSQTLEVVRDSPFARDVSLFHSILKLAIECPLQDQTGAIASWLTLLKHKSLQVLKIFWKSPLSADIVMPELRTHSFFTQLWISQPVIGPQTQWSASGLQATRFGDVAIQTDINDFLSQRAKIFQYVASELRSMASVGSASMRKAISNTLLGSTVDDGGQRVQNATVFDMFDFMALDPWASFPSTLPSFLDLDFSVCIVSSPGEPVEYDIKRVESLLVLKQNELRSFGQLNTPDLEDQYIIEAQRVVGLTIELNAMNRFNTVRTDALEAWSHVLTMIVAVGSLDSADQLRTILEAVLVIYPKLERHHDADLETLQPLASLAKFLVFSIDFKAETLRNDDVSHLANERLFQLFSASLKAVISPIGDALFRETLYGICYKYLTGLECLTSSTGASPKSRNNASRAIRSAGERVIQTISDDIDASEHGTRTSALLLLTTFVDMSKREGKEANKHLIEQLVRVNCLNLVVGSLTSISSDIKTLSESGRTQELNDYISFIEAKLALLLSISSTRLGAAAVVSEQLFDAIRASGVFAADPDYGLDVEQVSMRKHFELLLSFMRVINAVVVSRGDQNQQTLGLARRFVSENRLYILTVFKRSERDGRVAKGDDAETEEIVDELAESYLMLIGLSGFLDVSRTQ